MSSKTYVVLHSPKRASDDAAFSWGSARLGVEEKQRDIGSVAKMRDGLKYEKLTHSHTTWPNNPSLRVSEVLMVN